MGVGPLTRRAVFLDRDGVLNRAIVRDGKPYPPGGPAELEIVAGARAGLLELKRRGFLLVVVTNQPDVARGRQSPATVQQMHDALRAELPIDDFFVCYHDDGDGCACRKPRPGLLVEAARKYTLALSECYLIGDRWRDIEAGHAAGCTTVWIDHGYRERRPAAQPQARVSSFPEAVDWITRQLAEGNPLEAPR